MRRRARPGGGRQHEVTIEGVGARGDGYATFNGEIIYAPLTLAGDRVLLRVSGSRRGGATAELIELLAEGPGRTEPPCPYFGRCGGCALQHMEAAHYADWKAALLPQALAHRGFSGVPIRPLTSVPPGTRRRAALAAIRHGGKVRLGFHGRESHDLVDIEACLLLTPALGALLAPLRQVLGTILGNGQRAEVHVTETETGTDILFVAKGQPGLAAREALAAFANACDVARLSWAEAAGDGPAQHRAASEPEPILVRRAPRITLGGVTVEPVPGGFLQPSREGEAALTEAVLAYLPAACEAVVDLFCGAGTFTFALSGRARVLAVDGTDSAVAALWAAARRADLASRIAVEVRDLAREPLLAEELSDFSAVVFHPPRTGAREQARELAKSGVPTVIADSCNPNSFARDARILVDGGYRLIEVTPVDQFPWSGHLELVAQFSR